MSNDSRFVLVTGASGGIGRAVCARLAQSGHALVLAARDEGRLLALCDELRSLRPGRYEAIPVEMGDDVAVAAFGERLVAQGIVLDGVVLMPPQMLPTNDCLPPNDTWRTLFQRSFIGPLGLLKAVIPAMRPDPARGQRVKVVIISAVTSVQALGNYATSNVLRCAWLAEAKTLAFALGERGIHINTLSLGGTLTPDYAASVQRRADQAGVSLVQRLAEETSNIPLGKYGRPEEVAVVVDQLLGAFSDHMTGANLLHDGGFTRAY
jgi:3-oxoacyl-[acyl-carrier protein] reductase